MVVINDMRGAMDQKNHLHFLFTGFTKGFNSVHQPLLRNYLV